MTWFKMFLKNHNFFNYSRLGYVFFKNGYEGDNLPY